MHDIAKSVILGIVEGVTEFLPISSTGHLIIVNEFVDFTGSFAKTFDIVIQLGAILSVAVYFWKRLFPFYPSYSAGERRAIFDLWVKAIIGVLPALALGFLLHDYIRLYLFSPITVAIALIAGGILLIFLERRTHRDTVTDVADLTYRQALVIGCIQCLAMVPGTSRSAATIIGAMALGCSRLAAAEFSFFLAIPTMVAATGYSLLKGAPGLTGHQLTVLAVGFAVSFIVALLVIAAFMRFITRRDFTPFGWYRIVLGAAVLVYFLAIR